MHISQLYLHPVKSAASVPVDSLTYDVRGPKFDRQWMLVDQQGMFMSQRKTPQMCLLRANILENHLHLNAPNTDTLIVTPSSNEHRTVHVWGDEMLARDCGDPAAVWLSEFLGHSCRLVEVSTITQRLVDTDYAKQGETVGFADGFPSLIASSASLQEFNRHLEEPVDMRRFRPNIVIEGCEPYAEDTWRAIRIGDLEFSLVKPCSRCIMPSINPDTATKEMAVNTVLMKTRRRERQTYFGQNAIHSGSGEVRVGDYVEVLT